jgi:hypothetical protein
MAWATLKAGESSVQGVDDSSSQHSIDAYQQPSVYNCTAKLQVLPWLHAYIHTLDSSVEPDSTSCAGGSKLTLSYSWSQGHTQPADTAITTVR